MDYRLRSPDERILVFDRYLTRLTVLKTNPIGSVFLILGRYTVGVQFSSDHVGIVPFQGRLDDP